MGRPFRIFKQWTDRVMDEFFTQADMERQLGLNFAGGLSRGYAPLDRRKPFNTPKFQLGFAKMVVLPAFSAIETLPDFELKGQMSCLLENIETLAANADAHEKEVSTSANATL